MLTSGCTLHGCYIRTDPSFSEQGSTEGPQCVFSSVRTNIGHDGKSDYWYTLALLTKTPSDCQCRFLVVMLKIFRLLW